VVVTLIELATIGTGVVFVFTGVMSVVVEISSVRVDVAGVTLQPGIRNRSITNREMNRY
jgi:hypothetical protein